MKKTTKKKMVKNMKKATRKGNNTPGVLLPDPHYMKKNIKRRKGGKRKSGCKM